MYTENNRHTSVERANDDFLRRMLGGELIGGARAVMSEAGEIPAPSPAPGCAAGDGRRGDEREERTARAEERPSCNEGDGNACPQYPNMPSLAMVYAPYQCWQNLLDPESALEQGSQFAELILPLETAGGCARAGGGKGRC